MADELPPAILDRRDKMGFPVPLKEWFSGELYAFVQDIFHSRDARQRDYVNADAVLANFEQRRSVFAQDLGALSLELWQQQFHDRAVPIAACSRRRTAGRQTPWRRIALCTSAIMSGSAGSARGDRTNGMLE